MTQLISVNLRTLSIPREIEIFIPQSDNPKTALDWRSGHGLVKILKSSSY
jgi:hypothetical protein